MRTRSKVLGSLVGASLLVVSAAPANARGWGWGPPRHYHRDRGSDAGAVIGAIAAVGIIAAIASAASSSKNKPAPERRYDDQPYVGPDDQDGYYDRGAPRPGDEDGARYDNRANPPPRNDDARGSVEGAAVDACAVAARDQAGRSGDYAEISSVDSVAARGSGFDVAGKIDQRSSYSASDGWSRNFRCAWQDGRVSSVTLD